jgi:hypothetical protein
LSAIDTRTARTARGAVDPGRWLGRALIWVLMAAFVEYSALPIVWQLLAPT